MFWPLASIVMVFRGKKVSTCIYSRSVLISDSCSSSTLNCQNGGYPDPTDCSRCRCTDLYGGTECNEIRSGSSGKQQSTMKYNVNYVTNEN